MENEKKNHFQAFFSFKKSVTNETSNQGLVLDFSDPTFCQERKNFLSILTFQCSDFEKLFAAAQNNVLVEYLVKNKKLKMKYFFFTFFLFF
jgi:hypothetical protein